MIYEVRTYKLLPGFLDEFINLYTDAYESLTEKEGE
jgi:hypothetical protein